MKVVMVSKALVVATYRAKLREIARLGVEVTAVAPKMWHEGGSPMAVEPGEDSGYRLVTTDLRWNGHFHWHYYPELPAILQSERPDIVHVDEEAYNLAAYLAVRAAGSVGARSLFFTWQNLHRRYPPPFSWF